MLYIITKNIPNTNTTSPKIIEVDPTTPIKLLLVILLFPVNKQIPTAQISMEPVYVLLL